MWTLVRAIVMGLGATLLCTWAPLAAVRAVPPWLVLRRDVAPGRRGPGRALTLAAGRARASRRSPSGRPARSRSGGLFVGGLDRRAAGAVGAGARPGLATRPADAARPRSGLAARRGGAGQRPGSHAPARRRRARHRGDAAGDGRAAAGRAGPPDRPRAAARTRRPSSSSTSSRTSASRSRASSSSAAGTPPILTPVVRARLAAIDGERLTRDVVERRARGDASRGRPLVLHARVRADLERDAARHNAILQGRWWSAGSPRPSPRRRWKRPPPAISVPDSARG